MCGGFKTGGEHQSSACPTGGGRGHGSAGAGLVADVCISTHSIVPTRNHRAVNDTQILIILWESH